MTKQPYVRNLYSNPCSTHIRSSVKSITRLVEMKSPRFSQYDVEVRRYIPSDKPHIEKIYRYASWEMGIDGFGRVLLEYYSYWPLFAVFSAICLLNNWWRPHIALYLTYILLPYIVSLALLWFAENTDIRDPDKYFANKPKTALFVADWNGKAIGMVGIKQAELSKAGKFAGLRKPDDAELVRMFILPEYQGFGISKLLMLAALQFSKDEGYKRIILTSSTLKYVATTILYPKYGFVVDKETNIFGIKPVFMSKVIDNE